MSLIRWYVAIIAVAAATVALVLYVMEPAIASRELTAVLVFAALGVVTHSLGFDLARSADGSIGFLVYMTSVLVSPSWVTVAAVAGSVAIVEISRQRLPLKKFFNVVQYSLAAGASSMAYVGLGGRSLLSESDLNLAAYFGLFATFMVVNTVAVSGAIAFSERRRIWQVWQENTLSTIPYDVLALPSVYVFAKIYLAFGVSGVLIVTLPLIGIRQLYKTNWQLQRVNQELLQLMVAAIEARDPYTCGHSQRVSHYAKVIARILGLSSRQIERVGVAALLHDVGKIHEEYAPILRKPDKLTLEEQLVIQTHPIRSAELVANVSQLHDIVASVRHHHENWDGSGYPDGLAQEQIPLTARIIMLADTIDAMTSDRPYRRPLTKQDVRTELERFSGKQFDPAITTTLLASNAFDQLFSGSLPAYTPQYPIRAFQTRSVRTA